MELMVPSGSWFEWLVQSAPSGEARGHAATDEPTMADVDESIEAMRAGHVEYIVLDAGDGTFVQAAGEGDAGYQLEHWAGGSAVSATANASLADVRAAMAAYLDGERPEPPAGDAEEKRKKRWFGRS